MAQPTTYLATLPTHLYREVMRYCKSDVIQEMINFLDDRYNDPMALRAFNIQYRNLGCDMVRNKYLTNYYRRIDKKGKGRLREMDFIRLICDLERPIVWHSNIYGWSEWFVRNHLYANSQTMRGICWNSIYEPSKLSLAGWYRLRNSKQSYDTTPRWEPRKITCDADVINLFSTRTI